MHEQFSELGYTGPVRVLTQRECQLFLQATAATRAPLDWEKGHAANARAYYEISTHPAILEVVTAVLGPDVMLWGASLLSRSGGAVHPWHSDIESCSPTGKTVSVWIGLENTTRESALLVVPYSHQLGVTVQEVRHHRGKGRQETTTEDVLRWAGELDERVSLQDFEMGDGDALFFDGRLWHYSLNQLGKTRKALLLQYATPDTPIRIPDFNYLDWPFHQYTTPRPPCLMLRGTAPTGTNRIVSAPLAPSVSGQSLLSSRIYPLALPLAADPQKGWKPYYLFEGSTPDLRDLTCHVSALLPGQSPHPPHQHKEEEILLVLSGEVDVILPEVQSLRANNQRLRLTRGQFVYYPANFAHTLEAVGTDTANYLMFKWYADPTNAGSPLPFRQFDALASLQEAPQVAGFQPRVLFEGVTNHLRKLHAHVTTLSPGAGYDEHVDAYDVAILALEGELETLGQRVEPNSLIFYPSGQPHGMRNPGTSTARYLVFEFHGSQSALDQALPYPKPGLFTKLTDPQRWKRKAKGLLRRLKS